MKALVPFDGFAVIESALIKPLGIIILYEQDRDFAIAVSNQACKCFTFAHCQECSASEEWKSPSASVAVYVHPPVGPAPLALYTLRS